MSTIFATKDYSLPIFQKQIFGHQNEKFELFFNPHTTQKGLFGLEGEITCQGGGCKSIKSVKSNQIWAATKSSSDMNHAIPPGTRLGLFFPHQIQPKLQNKNMSLFYVLQVFW